MTIQHIANLTELAKLTNENQVIVIDFYTTWCGPCKAIEPYFQQLSETYKNYTFVKVDADEAEDVCDKYQVNSMPTFILLKNDIEIGRVSGASRTSLETLLKSVY